jgi:hypothetical protein
MIAPTWDKATFFGWIAEFRRHPLIGASGFAVGLVFRAFASWADHLSRQQVSVLRKAPEHLQPDSPASVMVGVVLFTLILGTADRKEKRTGVFVFSFFAAILLCSLARAFAIAISGGPLW